MRVLQDLRTFRAKRALAEFAARTVTHNSLSQHVSERC